MKVMAIRNVTVGAAQYSTLHTNPRLNNGNDT